MVLVTRVTCNEESNGDGSRSNGNEGDRQATTTRAMAMVKAMTCTMVPAMRLAGDKEGKGEGNKGDGNSDEGGGQQRVWW